VKSWVPSYSCEVAATATVKPTYVRGVAPSHLAVDGVNGQLVVAEGSYVVSHWQPGVVTIP